MMLWIVPWSSRQRRDRDRGRGGGSEQDKGAQGMSQTRLTSATDEERPRVSAVLASTLKRRGIEICQLLRGPYLDYTSC